MPQHTQPSSLTGLFARAALLASACLAAPALAAPPQAVVTVSYDGGAPVTYVLDGYPGANNTQVYLGSYGPGGSLWLVTVNIVADYLNDTVTALNGTITATNNTASSHTFACSFDVPICPGVTEGSFVGGTAKMTLITSGAGQLSCLNGVPVMQMTGNGSVIQSLFYCPFSLSITGSGSISSNTQFGLPLPSQAGPPVVESIGVRQQFTLTSGDQGQGTLGFQWMDANGIPANPCPWDTNADGVVGGADLALIFGTWGATNTCPASLPADLNGDGIVNGGDVGVLLDHWGPCPG